MTTWFTNRLGFRAQKTRHSLPSLDAMLGFALLRDPRVSRLHKARALMLGGGLVVGAIAAATLAGHWLGIPGRGLNVIADGLGLVSGSLLFGALLLMRVAPKEVVTRVRCERYTVIPLRARQPQSEPMKTGPTDGETEGQ